MEKISWVRAARALAGLVLLGSALAQGQATDLAPYAPIANPLPISGVDQLVRDSLTLKPGRVRVNQAGYRVTEVKADMAKFYYVGAASAFQVIDSATRTVVGTGTLAPKGFNSGTKFGVRAATWAGRVAGGDTRYTLNTDRLGTTIPSTGVLEGVLPNTLTEGGKYRVVVGRDTSTTFLVSDAVYGMVRDGILKFFGIQRSGEGPSWFHPPSHTKDGAVDVPSAPGAYQGGWYDCGDHLKEPITMSFALATLATMSAALPERDANHYGLNHANTQLTDGIPDVLAEARFGAGFFLRSWVRNGRKTASMVTGVGNFGADHGWWGRPENQDAMTEKGRGGWKERDLARIMGSGSIANQATGLALLSRRYRPYDAKWADTALMAAKDMYAFAKSNVTAYGPGIAPYSQGKDKAKANLALAAIALLWATKDAAYLNDLAYDKTLGPQGGDPIFFNSAFDGGWLAAENKFFNMARGTANFDFANMHPMVLYAFHKLILSNADSAKAYGVKSEAERILLGRRTINTMIGCLVAVSGSGASITLPGPEDGGGATRTLSYDPNWFKMYVQQPWVWNRYYIANAAELFFYHDMATDFANGRFGVEFTGKDWKRDDVRQLMVRQLDYQLGVNPWDVSMIMGLGDKNFNHPHHRAANPEGRNTPGASYGYKVPVGALYGSYDPENPPAFVDYFDDYHRTEVCTDGGAVSLAAVMGLAAEVPVVAPKPTVKVVYVSDTSAQIEVLLDKYGTVTLDYGADATARTKSVTKDSAGVKFVFLLGGLKPATQYFFDVTARDISGNVSKTSKWENPIPDGTPFNFTTKAFPQGKAQIENVKVCNVTSDSAEIMWYTPNGEYQSSICWGPTPTEGPAWKCAENIDQSGHPVKFHYVKIGDLKEKTDYWFKVGSDGTWDDNKGAYYTFRTPVKMADFGIFTVKYTVGGMPAMAINIANNEARTYDSLTLRVYVRSKDTIAPIGHLWGQALTQVPVRFSDALQARYDICQAYNGAGFNMPCSDSSWGKHPVTGGAWDWGMMGAAVQLLQPVKMPETYDPKDSTYAYYFNLPLGPTAMVQQSRIRFDVIFGDKSIYSKAPSTTQGSLLNWIRAFTPDQGVFPDTGWFDQGPVGPEKWHTWGANTRDWSFIRHSTAAGDPVDFPGMMEVADQAAADDLIDGMSTDVVLNPYITVYRKGEFVYGFSPSYIEQSQKKTYWGINTKLQAPFDVPNGSTIVLDQAGSTVRVKGTADVFDKLTPAAKGGITDIWVNGARLTKAQIAAAATWNATTKLWDLDIPVKLGIGGNNVDVTIFGGPKDCPDTSTTCTGGCAFFNAEFFMQFTKGNATQSVLSVVKTDGSVYPVKTAPDSLELKIRLADKDQSKKGSLGATATVTVSNPLRGFSKSFTLTESVDTGVFLSGALVLTAKSGALSATEIPFLRGDSLWFTYRDPSDEEDSSKTFVYSEAAWPVPVRAGLFRDCAGAYQVRALFDKAFGATTPWQDAVVTLTSPAGDSVGAVTVAAAQIAKGAGFEIVLPLSEAAVGSWQNGRLSIPVSDGRGGWIDSRMTISDSIGPWVDSVKLVENVLGKATDTAYVWISERVRSLPTGSFVRHRAGVVSGLLGVDSLRSLDATGRSWILFLQRGVLATNDSLRLLSTSSVRDLAANAPSECPSQARLVSLVPRPAPFSRAWILDADGDGQADEVKLVYRKILDPADLPDSVELGFGVPSELRVAKVLASMVTDSVLTIPLAQPFAWGATRGANADGSGGVAIWEKGSRSAAAALVDSVGPVLRSAGLRYARSGSNDTLVLTFSEPVQAGAGAGWLTNPSGANLGAADASSSSASLWFLPVAAGSVAVGDSVKPLATHRWVDVASGRHAPVGHRWIEVGGGDRAPSFGWFADQDEDGAVDHIHIRFGGASPKTRPGMVFSYGNGATLSIDSGSWSLDADGRGATLAVGPLAQGLTSFGANPKGAWSSLGSSIDFPMHDSVGPVLVSATLRYASRDSVPDTLRVRWSEALKGANLSPLVLHKVAGVPVDVEGSASLDADGLGATILVLADSAGFARGDMARLAPKSRNTATDLFGNASEAGVWVPIKIGARPIRLDFTSRNFVEIPVDDPSTAAKGMVVLVRARPERGSSDTLWGTLDASTVPPDEHTVHLTMTVNRPLEGSAYLFDNSGVFVTALDLSPLVQLSQAGRLPTDASGMLQVRVAWNGRDPQGKLVATGVYRMRLVLKDGGGDTGEPVRIINKVYTFGIKRPVK